MRTEESHFWLGWFATEDSFADFVGENPEAFEDDDVPLSRFAESQGKTWLDHDFMESGFEVPVGSLKEQFGLYSYAHQWVDELAQRASSLNVKDANVLVFINVDQIESPVSIQGDGFRLQYMGSIEYEI